MERISIETEEDYQTLINILTKFGVKVYRPTINPENNFDSYCLIREDGRKWYQPPPMNPRDELMVTGNRLLMNRPHGPHYVDFYDEIINSVDGTVFHAREHPELRGISMPAITRVGTDIYIDSHGVSKSNLDAIVSNYFADYTTHIIQIGGHNDGVFCPVSPGLIVSLEDAITYKDTFPGWEVVYLPNQSWDAIQPFLELKQKNNGRWWVPGEEHNDDLIEFVDTWLSNWVGYVEETVFDVNMLVIDEKNVICNNYNKTVFDAFSRRGITPHICNFRHRYFWDGGLHCISLDLFREGTKLNYHEK